jgi:hypothetical protein
MSEPEKTNGQIDANEPPFVLSDADGPIPTFGPAKLDEQGRIVMSDEEWAARARAARRTLAVLREQTLDDEDAPGTWEEVMRSIDAARPSGLKKFEGMY